MKSCVKYFLLIILLCGSFQVHAATGVIDPLFHTAQVCESSSCAITGTSSVNFGVFSTASASNATVTDTELTGFIWGHSFGWAVLNCVDTTSGCIPANGNFKVANTTSGHLSGYAWGEDAGWINFGPFINNGAAPVVINSIGEFNGYAWSQNYGWIKFDCSLSNYCVKTDWRPSVTYQCSDGVDNTDPEDTLVDAADPGCINNGVYTPTDNDETDTPGGGGGGGGLCTDPGATNYLTGTPCTYPTICMNINATNYGGALPCTYPVRYCEDQSALNYLGFLPCTYICSDQTDNDGDNLVDAADPGCYTNGVYNPNDNDETNVVCTGPSCNPPPTYECSDGIDNSDPEDTFVDRNDPGCYTGGVYYATDNSEDNCGDPLASNYGSPARCRYPSTITDPSGSTCVGVTCIVGGPLFNTTTQFVAPIGAFFGLALALAQSLFANPITFSEIFIIPARLWALLFIKRRYRPWGVVYDSVTKQPLDPAYVVLQDLQGNEITTCITDLDGRYGFLVPAGEYRMIANKTNYEFPSKKLAGKTSDELYSDLYFNEIVTVKEGEVIIKNIPMDPLKFDWNEYAKQDQKLMKFYSKRDLWIARISRVLFYFGFILTTAAVIVSPILYNIVIFLIYIILFIFQHTLLRPRPFGSITEHGAPLAYAIIKVFSVENNREVVKKVSTQIGRYYCLVPNGSYYLTIERKNADQSYTLAYTSQVINVTEGYINKKFRI